MGSTLAKDNSVVQKLTPKFKKKQNYSKKNDTIFYDNIQDSLININRATEEELMTLPKISRSLARKIIYYRENINSFRSIDDLNFVPESVLNQIRDEICIEKETSRAKDMIRKSVMNDIYELLSVFSSRPSVKEIKSGEEVVRLATWNLQISTIEKLMNPGVLETICLTILENRFTLIFLQEISEHECLKIICDEINDPKLTKVKEFKNKIIDSWHFQFQQIYSRTLGFIYDANYQLLTNVQLIHTPSKKAILTVNKNRKKSKMKRKKDGSKKKLTRIMVVMVEFNNLYLRIMNMSKFKAKTQLTTCFVNHRNNFILVGTDLNQFGILKNFKAVLTNQCFDNILINDGVYNFFNGNCGIIFDGLTHLAIPNGWTWGGSVSEHYPVWCEFVVQ